jgi:O-acetyl-ADP-ribose deacetylase
VNTLKLRLIDGSGKLLEINGPADITKETTDAIVNAANSSLLGGGGVDGAIHRAAGPEILQQCKQIVAREGRLAPGKAVLTTGGRLNAKYVVHTVGPIYRSHTTDPEILSSCYRESMHLADKHGIRSISFPSISTGAFGYPVHDAAAVAVATVLAELQRTSSLCRIRFVLFDAATLQAYSKAAEKMVGPPATTSYEIERAS